MGKAMLVLIILLVFFGYTIVTSYNLDLSKSEDQQALATIYGKWLVKVGESLKEVVGYAIKEDWQPEENKNDTKTTNRHE